MVGEGEREGEGGYDWSSGGNGMSDGGAKWRKERNEQRSSDIPGITT